MVSISPSRPSSELGGRRGYRRYRPESRDVSRARPCNTDPRRASARRVDRAARTRPRRAAPAHSRSGLGEFAPTCARGSARRTPAPLTPCLHAERAVQSPVDVRAESREARLEVRRQLRAAALEPRVARATRGKQQNTGIGQSWYRLKSVFGVILLNIRSSNQSRIPDQGVCVFTAREKHDTYPIRGNEPPLYFNAARRSYFTFFTCEHFVCRRFFPAVEQDGTFFVTRSAHPPDPRARRRYLSVFPSRSARST